MADDEENASSNDEEHEEKRRMLQEFNSGPAFGGDVKKKKKKKTLKALQTRRSEALLSEMVSKLQAWVLENLPKGPLVGTPDTIVNPPHRAECERNATLNRVSTILDTLQCVLETETQRPAGSLFQRNMWSCAARPPFPLIPGMGSMQAAASIDDIVAFAHKELMLSVAGMVRLQSPLVAICGEWRVDAVFCGLALLFQYQNAQTQPLAPAAIVNTCVSLAGIPEDERKRPCLTYIGYAYCDSSLVAAAAGVADFA